MNLIRQQLEREHKSIDKAYNIKSFCDFYNSIFNYFDFAEKQPDICKIIENDRNDVYERMQQIDANLSKKQKEAVVNKIEKYSLSFKYDKVLKKIYTPIKQYRELLSPIKNREHTLGCALSDGESEPLFVYLFDIVIYLIVQDHNEKNYAYFKISYFLNMSEYKKIINEIHSMIGTKIIEKETIPKNITIKGLEFDREKSILTINNKDVKIKFKSDKPDAHYILEYLFDNGVENTADYCDILKDKFPMSEKDNSSMYRACNDINRKVFDQAGIKEFLDIHSGKSGWVKINSPYA